MTSVGNHQEHLQEDKWIKKKTQTATTPAASTWNIIVDTDGLKLQDDTATV